MSCRLENMVDGVLPAPAGVDAFIRGLTEQVGLVPAMDLSNAAPNAVEDRKPKGLADVHAATLKLFAEFEACRHFKGVLVRHLAKDASWVCTRPQGYA